MRRLSRRRFLQLAVVGGGAVSIGWLGGCTDDDAAHFLPAPTPTPLPAPEHFFSAEERALVERLAGAVIPEGDGIAGAASTDVVEYIDRFLAAFEGPLPILYRGGPNSGRWPFPDPDSGAPSGDYPRNDFEDALPLSRMQDLAFRIELYGSAAVANGEINAPIVVPWPGLRNVYRNALRELDESGLDIEMVEDSELLAALAQAPGEFQTAFLRHLGEGMFCAPEYGGNAGLRGWSDYHYDGDSQPLGHTLFAADGTPRDRPDQPNQSEDPNRPPIAFAAEVEAFLTTITRAQSGTKFY